MTKLFFKKWQKTDKTIVFVSLMSHFCLKKCFTSGKHSEKKLCRVYVTIVTFLSHFCHIFVTFLSHFCHLFSHIFVLTWKHSKAVSKPSKANKGHQFINLCQKTDNIDILAHKASSPLSWTTKKPEQVRLQ